MRFRQAHARTNATRPRPAAQPASAPASSLLAQPQAPVRPREEEERSQAEGVQKMMGLLSKLGCCPQAASPGRKLLSQPAPQQQPQPLLEE